MNDLFSFLNNKNTNLGLNVSFPNNISQGGERYTALFGSGQIGFRDYLFLDITARNDWSSRLPKNNRSYFYPSVGISFVLSEAVKLPEAISHTKVRASYAEVGNTTPSRYFANENYSNGSYLQGDAASATTSYIPSSVPPITIRPEKNRSFEFGLETGFLRDRINLDITYFANRGVDLLSSAVVAPSSGASSIRANSGILTNNGLEITLGADIVRAQNFTWHADFNTSIIKRKVIDLGEGFPSVNGLPPERLLGNPYFGAAFKAVVGASPYDIYMTKWQRNANGQFIVDGSGNLVPETSLSYMGSSLPKAYGGLSNRFSYKGFDLQVMMAYRFGGKVVSYSNSYLLASGSGTGSLFGRDAEHGGVAFYTAGGRDIVYTGQTIPAGSVLRNDGIIIDGVKTDGVTKNDIVVPASAYYSRRYGAFGREDAVYKNNYIYLSEVSINYTLPKVTIARLGLQNITIGLVGRNLLWIYKSLPNVSAFSTLGTSGAAAGVEYTALPNTRNIGFSLKARF